MESSKGDFEMIIDSQYDGIKWIVTVKDEELSKEDESFIRSYAPLLFWNDLEGFPWCYDTKLPSGRWLENIRPNNALTEVKALIL